jgi:hypothetical protein
VSEETNGHDSPSRFERLEKIVEVLANGQVDMQQTQRILLRSQVVMSEDLKALSEMVRGLTGKTNERSRETDERFRALAEAQTAMLGTMDRFVRRLP